MGDIKAGILALALAVIGLLHVQQSSAQSVLPKSVVAVALAPGNNEVIALWPSRPPGSETAIVDWQQSERITFRENQDPSISAITRPVMAVYRPAQANGTAVLIIPGGGFRHLAGGPGLARFMASRGVTAFLLIYRLAQDGWAGGPDTPLQDAQRALRLMRSGAEKWQLDTTRLGVIGSSAGGHVAGQLITRFDATVYAPVDEHDRISARPDFASLNYAVSTMQGPFAHSGSRNRLLGGDSSSALQNAYSNEQRARADMPPVFLIHAADDTVVPFENSVMMHAAIRRQNVRAELHIFETGGHGFALGRMSGSTAQIWPELFFRWGIANHFFNETVLQSPHSQIAN